MDRQPEKIVEPLIVPAALDPDAVKILRRLHRHGHEAYFVGGCVRDLSLGHIPKDFDVATSARPRQIKRLFRNSRIIGRRFKLVHVQFGDKIIEVSTFRSTPRTASDEVNPSEDDPRADEQDEQDERDDGDEDEGDKEDLLIRRDNVFGNAEEDAVRRDFTINGLFYDIEQNVVLDYVGGAEDLRRRVIRTIGDPDVRMQEDPVRALRAIKFASRLTFAIAPDTLAAMKRWREDLARCAAPRMSEELLRLLSCGGAKKAFELLEATGILGVFLPEIADFVARSPQVDGWPMPAREQLLRYLAAVDEVDRGRRRLSNAVLLAVLLVGPIRERLAEQKDGRDPGLLADSLVRPFATRMAVSRRDSFRLKQIVTVQARMQDPRPSRRRRRMKPAEFARRDYFPDALAFMRIESIALDRDLADVERWTDIAERGDAADVAADDETPFDEAIPMEGDDELDGPPGDDAAPDGDDAPKRRRRRRRGGRRRRGRRGDAEGSGDGQQAAAPGPSHRDDPEDRDRKDSRRPERDEPRETERSQPLARGDASDGGGSGFAGRRKRRKRDASADQAAAPPRQDGSTRRDDQRDTRRDERSRSEREEPDERDGRDDSDERPAAQDAHDEHDGERTGKRRRRRGRGRRRGGRDGAGDAVEGARPAPENGRRGDDREGRDRRRDERGRKDERGRRPQDAQATRLEFDEVRAGPLRPPTSDANAGADEPEVEEIHPEVAWDDPLPQVGDPGPISMIRTGIDQTERKGKRRRKKMDANARDLSKEVQHQPGLQAFKMTEGDPRGHEATRPPKPRRTDMHEPEAALRERPIDPVEDFEAIEDVFRW